MSYILDALKKADAERERGSVPGLHSQPLGQQIDDDGDAPRAIAPAVWLGAGMGLCLIGVLSWQWLSRDAAVPATDLPAATPPVALVQTAPPPAMPAPPPLAISPATPITTTGSPPVEARPSLAPPAPLAPTQAPARTREANREPPPTQGPAAAPPHAQPSARVPTVSELPEDIRRDLPQLVIGGAMYSDTPSSRMLIINSQVFHEGDQPYQGLVLEEIRLKSAVFKFRGHRYAVNY